MERGYVKVYRKALDCGLIQDARVWQVLSWCLLKATHRRFRTFFNGRFVDLAPGQLVTSREAACRELLLSVQQFRTALGKLLSAGTLACEATSWGTVITIVNWHVYQHGISEGQPGEPPGGNRETTRPSTIIQEQKHTGYPVEAGGPDARAGRAEDAGGPEYPEPGPRAGKRAAGYPEPGARGVRGGKGAAVKGEPGGAGVSSGARVRGARDAAGDGAARGRGNALYAKEFEEPELPPWALEAGA